MPQQYKKGKYQSNMNKGDLIDAIAADVGINKVIAKAVLEACLKSISNALAESNRVQITGFGTFSVAEKPERIAINPRTKEKINIALRRTVKFKPAPDLGNRH